MTKTQTTQLVRNIRRARGEEETVLGNNPEAYLRDLQKDQERVRKLLEKAGIYDAQGRLTTRYR
jgi:hypothetical protein